MDQGSQINSTLGAWRALTFVGKLAVLACCLAALVLLAPGCGGRGGTRRRRAERAGGRSGGPARSRPNRHRGRAPEATAAEDANVVAIVGTP